MSEFYWPLSGEVGTYDLSHKNGGPFLWIWNGVEWQCPDRPEVQASQACLEHWGYLGVRREPAKLQQGPQLIVPVTDTSITANLSVVPPTPKTLAPDPDDGNAMVAQEALDELRMCRKSYQFERWSIKWGRPLTEMLGAR